MVDHNANLYQAVRELNLPEAERAKIISLCKTLQKFMGMVGFGTVTAQQRGSSGRDSMRISPPPPMTAPGRTMSKEVGAGQDVAGVQSPNVDPWQIWDWKREIV